MNVVAYALLTAALLCHILGLHVPAIVLSLTATTIALIEIHRHRPNA